MGLLIMSKMMAKRPRAIKTIEQPIELEKPKKMNDFNGNVVLAIAIVMIAVLFLLCRDPSKPSFLDSIGLHD